MKRIAQWAVYALAILWAVSCAYAEPDSDAEDSEESLRWLLSDQVGQGEFERFYYGDYDGDGIHEAFAFVGAEDDFLLEGSLWFVSPIACAPIQEGLSYVYMRMEGDSAPILFSAEESYGGSKSTSHLWTVIDSWPVAIKADQFEGFSYAGNNEFHTFPSEFDMWSDGTGHTWKCYYYFLDGLTLREYGGISITLDELLEFEGAGEIVTKAMDDGYTIGDILYRGNNIINVNLRKNDGFAYRNDNLTLRYGETSVVDTGEEYGGVYKQANTPNVAVYPKEFIHPTGNASSIEDWKKQQCIQERIQSAQNSAFFPYDVGFGEDGHSYVYAYCGEEPEVTLPASFHEYGEDIPFSGIGDEAFIYCDTLETVIIPEGATNIGYRAFYGCENLKKVILPASMAYIAEEAFANCASLCEIVLPESTYMFYVAEDAFNGCGQLMLTERQKVQFTETESAADAAQQAAFVVDTENLTELSGCLGTDMNAFVGRFADMEECDYSDGIGYRNKDIEVYSSWMMDDVFIDRISILRKANYTLHGICVGMDLRQAREVLLSAGWIETEPTNWGMYFENARKDTLILRHNGAQYVEELMLSADYNVIDTWYGEEEEAFEDASGETGGGTGYTTGNVNLRTGPGLGYESVGAIPSGATVEYLGKQSVDNRGVAWYYIQYGGKTGWGSSKYVRCD